MMRNRWALAVVLCALAGTANAQERPNGGARWLAAAGIDAHAGISRALHLGAERKVASRFAVRMAGDYLTRGPQRDTTTAHVDAIGAGVLATYSVPMRVVRPYLVGGISVQRAWSTDTRVMPGSSSPPNACVPSIMPEPCAPRDPVVTPAGGAIARPTIVLPAPGADSLSTSTSVLTAPALVTGMGSSFRVGGLTGFVEVRATFVSVAAPGARWYVPVTVGLRF